MTEDAPSPSYYATHGSFTDPARHAALFEALPADVGEFCSAIQGLLIHDSSGRHLYGDPPPGFRQASRETLPVSVRLSSIIATDDRPISLPRAPFERAVGTCRDFALMLCAMLRQHGLPSRVRCGFATYFRPPAYEDHWVCEHWIAAERRWAVADPQLDEAHRAQLSIDFDVTDVPPDQFVPAAVVWSMVRSHRHDASAFGHGADATGEWFLQVNLARDLLALRKTEVSAWDTWRADRKRDAVDPLMMPLCDRAAKCALDAIGLLPPDLSAAAIQRFLSLPPWVAGAGHAA